MIEQLTILALAAAGGWLLDAFHWPVAWLLGPMLAGILFAVARGSPRRLSPHYQTLGQAVLGLSSGTNFQLHTLAATGTFIAPLVVAIAITAALSMLNGYLLWRWAGVDRATGFLGSLPGAASAIVAMSDEMGADGVSVAVLQYLRMIMTIFIAPMAVHALFGATGSAGVVGAFSPLPAAPLWLAFLFFALAGLAGMSAGRKLKMPAPTFLGCFLVAMLGGWALPYSFHMPTLVLSVGLMCMGVAVGARFDLPGARRLGRAVVVEVGLVLVLLMGCLTVGWAFHLATGVSPLTAVLGTAPGGMDVMVASATNMGGDPGLVLAMQMARFFVILLAGPWVTTRLARAG